MLILNLIFIWSCLKLLIKRSENCDLPRPNPKLKQNSYKFIHPAILLILFNIYWTQLQIIYALLLIGGIERNPGPESSNLIQSKTCTKNEDGIRVCNICQTLEQNPGPKPTSLNCFHCTSSQPKTDLLECSICFRLFHHHCISTKSSCTSDLSNLLKIRGKFIFVCELL